MPEPSESIQPVIGSLPIRPNVQPVLQELSGGRAYKDLVQKDQGLLAFWQMDTENQQTEAYVSEGVIPRLNEDLLADASVEFFFQVTSDVDPGYDPCLISLQKPGGSRQDTRYAIHLSRNLKTLRYWNGWTDTVIVPPNRSISPGKWIHFVAISKPRQEFRAYINGVECFLDMGSFAFGTFARDCPFQIGASSATGDDPAVNCAVDHVALYDRALSPDEIVEHVDASGFGPVRKQLVDSKNQKANDETEFAQKDLQSRLKDPELLDRGNTKVYRGDLLGGISFPVGGIGAGLIQMNGKAERSVWQIFNNFEHLEVDHSFFAVRTKTGEADTETRVLQTSDVGSFKGMGDLVFRGEYPFGSYEFIEKDLPVQVSLETFNPIIPLDAKNSAIPCAIYNLTASNPTDSTVQVSFLATQRNVAGFQAEETRNGGKVNEVLVQSGVTRARMSRTSDSENAGDLVLSAMTDHATFTASWESLEELHRQFSEDGDLDGVEVSNPSPDGETVDCAIATPFDLQPGESKTITFVLTWYFPDTTHGTPIWTKQGNMYTNWWNSALEVHDYVVAHLDSLTQETRQFHDALYASNLPYWLLDRLSSQLAILKSKTCFWAKDGYFGANEGCSPDSGCCLGNCSHVWHYAQAHARLFPEIAKRMREQTFDLQEETGGVPFRHSDSHLEKMGPAIDGMFGDILGTYREHLCSADGSWLEAHWPKAKKAMDFTINRWDPDEDGLLEGSQHNTLDGELTGSTSWMGTLYLAALAASEKMANLSGETEVANRYRQSREKGAENQNQTLWNGEYYVQNPDADTEEDYGDGCHIDQVLGEWWAPQVDVPTHYPTERVQSALQSLLQYNFKPNFHTTTQRPRKFVDNNDAAMKMISWPKGPQPFRSMKYGDEAMTGFEYAAAVTMVMNGMLEEGFVVAKAVYDRYDGRLRDQLTATHTSAWGYSGNPFGDDECGKFYARAMSIWSMLIACQGFVYDGPQGRLGFAPVWQPEDHTSFFTAAEGWGLFSQKRTQNQQDMVIQAHWGRISLRAFEFEVAEDQQVGKVTVQFDGEVVPSETSVDNQLAVVQFESPFILQAPGRLEITALYE